LNVPFDGPGMHAENTCMHACMHACIHTYSHTHMHTHTCYVCSTYACVRACMHAREVRHTPCTPHRSEDDVTAVVSGMISESSSINAIPEDAHGVLTRAAMQALSISKRIVEIGRAKERHDDQKSFEFSRKAEQAQERLESSHVYRTFEWTQDRDSVEEVAIIGEWSEWASVNAMTLESLKHSAGCRWTAAVRLPVGRFMFKFVVDGKWILGDKRRYQVVSDDVGTVCTCS